MGLSLLMDFGQKHKMAINCPHMDQTGGKQAQGMRNSGFGVCLEAAADTRGSVF